MTKTFYDKYKQSHNDSDFEVLYNKLEVKIKSIYKAANIGFKLFDEYKHLCTIKLVDVLNSKTLSFESNSQINAYFEKAYKNILINLIKKNKTSNRCQFGTYKGHLDIPSETSEEKSKTIFDLPNMELFNFIKKRLSKEECDFLRSTYQNGRFLSNNEIAKKLGISKQAVSKRLIAIRQKIKEIIDNQDDLF